MQRAATDEAQRQYELIALIDELYRANGIDTDMQTAIFLADHDLQPDEAVRQAMAVYSKQPDSIYAADAVAWTLYKADRAADALPYVEQALSLGTMDSSVHFHAGLVHNALGNSTQAREHLAAALEMNPHFSLINAPIAERTLAELSE